MSADAPRSTAARTLDGRSGGPSATAAPSANARSGSVGSLPQRLQPVLLVIGAGSAGYVLAKAWFSTWHHRLLDFAVYLMGAHHLADGRLYLATLRTPPHLLFTYPPFAALAFGPLVLLPFQWSQLLWILLSVGSLFAILALSLRAVRPGLPRREILVWSLVLMAPAYRFEPVLLTMAFGQVNLVLIALALADLTCTLRVAGRTLPRGVLVGVIAAVKLVPLVFVPYLFLTRQVRAGWVSLSTFVGCTLLAGALDPSVTWSYWTKYADDARRIGGVFYISNQSLRGVTDRLAHHVVPQSVVVVVSAAVLVGGLALARWAWHSSSNFLGVLVCATTGLLVSPISWAHHFVWAIPVALWLAFAPDRPVRGRLWAAAAIAIFWIAPIWIVPGGGELTEHGWQLVLGNSFFWVSALFMLGVAAMLTSRRREDRATSTRTAPRAAASA